MGLQPTASRTDLLMQCVRPFAESTAIDEREVGEAASYGTAFHTCMQWLYEPNPRMQVESDTLKHAKATKVVLDKWLAGDNPLSTPLKIHSLERALAFHAPSRQTRITSLDLDTHVYELRRREMGGTADMVATTADGTVAVIDYKTGDWGRFDAPAAMGQMRTLGLMTGADWAVIVHAPRGLAPIIYAEAFDTLDPHWKLLRRQMQRIGDGSMTPGPGCKYCPAKGTCPAVDQQLLASTTALVSKANEHLVHELDAGKVHMMLAEFDRLATRAKAIIKQRVMAGEVIERPDGKTLRIVEKEVESLSKSSITRALGKEKGERLIESLRKKGVVETSKREEMWAK